MIQGPILVPVDFSARSMRMMPYVKRFAETYGAEVILLHVVNPVIVIPATAFSESAPVRIPQWVVPERTKQLEAFASAELNGLNVRRLVYEGDPEAQIAAFAQTEAVGLIAMPTHGYGVFRRFLIGSVTAKVLHDVSCPVLTGAHTEAHTPMTEIRLSKIVCAVDLGPESSEPLAWAGSLARDFGAKLHVIHVRTRREQDDSARRELAELTTGSGAASIAIQEGDIAKEVSAFAESAGADLVVIGRGAATEGAGRLRTNAYAIIRQAGCPVLSV